MRFACQSCGKAYNLPEERIAEKSNVKLKCRVCGAIVEVKKQGEIVAQVLNEGEGKRLGRVSEAPSPLMSMSPDDADDATAAIAVGEHGLTDHILNDFSLGDPALSDDVHVEQNNRGLPFVPPAASTGFGGSLMPPPLSQSGEYQGSEYQGSEFQDGYPHTAPARPEAGVAPAYTPASLPPPPVPLSAPPPPLRSLEVAEAVHNGSNGSPRLAGEAVLNLPDAVRAPVASASSQAASAALPVLELASIAPAPMPRVGAERDDTRSKMMAALATGMLIGFIIAKLFF